MADCDLSPVTGSDLHAELDVDRRAGGRRVCRPGSSEELGPLGVVVTAAGIQRTGASEAVRDRTGGG